MKNTPKHKSVRHWIVLDQDVLRLILLALKIYELLSRQDLRKSVFSIDAKTQGVFIV